MIRRHRGSSFQTATADAIPVNADGRMLDTEPLLQLPLGLLRFVAETPGAAGAKIEMASGWTLK